MLDQKNVILAVVLSAIILFGSQYIIARFFPPPHPVATTTMTTSGPATTGGAVEPNIPAAPAVPAFKPRDAALADSPRIEIRSDRLIGSVSLMGRATISCSRARSRRYPPTAGGSSCST